MATKDKKSVYAPGTFNFNKVYLRDHDIDIRFKTLEINIFESIFQPCITGDILILDADNMIANLPIVEGDVIEIDLSFNEDDKIQQTIYSGKRGSIKGAFEVIKIVSRVKTKNQDVQTYTFRVASIGWSNNVRTRISRSYNKKKYSDVVKDIFNSKFIMPYAWGLKGYDSAFTEKDLKKIDIEDTHGSYSVVIPRWKPIQCFNWLAGRSQSGKNPSAVNYFFYEDTDNYNFKSADSLIKEDISDTYYIKLENIDKLDKRNYFNAFSYSYEDTGDILLNASSGTFGSRLIVHNMVSKEVDDHFAQGMWSLSYNIHGYPASKDEFGCTGTDPFSYTSEFDKLNHVDKEPLIDESVADTLSYNPGNTRLMVHSNQRYQYDGLKTNHPEQYMRQRIMQKPCVNYIRITLYSIGNFNRKCGQTVNVELPSPEEEKGKYDARLNGKYLVTTVRHIFKPTRYDNVIECIKDSFSG